MKTVVKALSKRRVIDGWGFEITFRRPQNITPGRHYILQNRSILRQLKTQEEIMQQYVYIDYTRKDYNDH